MPICECKMFYVNFSTHVLSKEHRRRMSEGERD